ncbi:hypothetical protein P4O66_000434 [Electrophorus voltai]|uniref:Actin-associated protein FAM107A n=1 Tax=Electrophorus voltai TaxID=2609070 RepID=A0AAD8ZK67_9TELE|nr:hypothetical protein P4O66_000434 [Electrophorus voltai]
MEIKALAKFFNNGPGRELVSAAKLKHKQPFWVWPSSGFWWPKHSSLAPPNGRRWKREENSRGLNDLTRPHQGQGESKPPQGVNPQGVNPQGVNPQGVNPQGVNPQGVNPQGVNLQGVNPQVINPQGVNLQGVNPQGVNPQGVNPQDVNLQGVNPQGVNLQGVNPQVINPQGVNPQGVNPQVINPQGVNPQGVNPQVINPQGVNPQGVNPQVVNPQGVNPQGINPQGVNPQVINPQGVNPQGVNPQVINPQGVNPQGVNPQGVNPQVINPQGVNPQVINPQGVNPQGVNPQVINPQGVNPQGVNPQVINPQGVNPQVINPQGVNLQVVPPPRLPAGQVLSASDREAQPHGTDILNPDGSLMSPELSLEEIAERPAHVSPACVVGTRTNSWRPGSGNKGSARTFDFRTHGSRIPNTSGTAVMTVGKHRFAPADLVKGMRDKHGLRWTSPAKFWSRVYAENKTIASCRNTQLLVRCQGPGDEPFLPPVPPSHGARLTAADSIWKCLTCQRRRELAKKCTEQPANTLLWHGGFARTETSAYANIQWEQPHQPGEPLQFPRRERLAVASYATQPDQVQGDDDLIKPKKLINPVKASKSHQELHRELLQNHRRGVENKSELQRVLEQRKRDQMIKQRKMEDEARRKVSPLEQELLKRQQKLYELEREQERQEETSCNAPEFIKVKENLRRTSFTSAEEKQV